jgi:ubiquinone biosynthesis monooxygenase Coq7
MSKHLAASPAPNLNAGTVAALADGISGLMGDLRSDHAGETGAVAIYLGILAGSRAPHIQHFAREHLGTEREHLARLGALLPPGERSVLLPLWRTAGRLTGFLPALIGPRAVYATVDAVETFVDREQMRKLPADGSGGALRALLIACRKPHPRHQIADYAETLSAHQIKFAVIAKATAWARVLAPSLRLARST